MGPTAPGCWSGPTAASCSASTAAPARAWHWSRRTATRRRPDWVRTVATGFRQLMGMDVALDPAGRLLVAGAAFEDYPSTGVLFMRFLTR